jgi:dynein heavy chain
MRIIRILKFERGNALLIGMGGSGRKSLTRLASFIRKYQCFEIEISKSYGVREFYEDLGTLLKIAGSEQQDISFLFTDTQIITD